MRTIPRQRIDALPPSDFKDLVLAIQQHEATFQYLVTFLSTSTERNQHFAFLVHQAQEIDASYGWVLASDIGLVARMFSGDACAAKKWLHEIARRLGEIKVFLKNNYV
jgi:hypothetical protein